MFENKTQLNQHYKTIIRLFRTYFVTNCMTSCHPKKYLERCCEILNRKLNGKNCLRTILNDFPHICLREVRKFIEDSGCQFNGSNLETVPSEQNYFHFVTILCYLGISYDKKDDIWWGVIWHDRIWYMYCDLDWWAMIWYCLTLYIRYNMLCMMHD